MDRTQCGGQPETCSINRHPSLSGVVVILLVRQFRRACQCCGAALPEPCRSGSRCEVRHQPGGIDELRWHSTRPPTSRRQGIWTPTSADDGCPWASHGNRHDAQLPAVVHDHQSIGGTSSVSRRRSGGDRGEVECEIAEVADLSRQGRGLSDEAPMRAITEAVRVHAGTPAICVRRIDQLAEFAARIKMSTAERFTVAAASPRSGVSTDGTIQADLDVLRYDPDAAPT